MKSIALGLTAALAATALPAAAQAPDPAGRAQPATAQASPRTVTLQPLREDTTQADFVALEAYIGSWRAEPRSTRGGRSFRFVLEFSWFDANRTMAELRIHQTFDDGERTLWWHGYKGWNPVSEETYYYGFSPSGRVSIGKVISAGNDFVTMYDAFGARGEQVELRDVFGPVKDDRFENVSYLRPAGSAEWRVVARDTWTRVEADEKLGSGEQSTPTEEL